MDEDKLSEQITGVLRAALADFRDRPFDDMREGDPQALIFAKLREVVEPRDTALRLRQLAPKAHAYLSADALRTNRVHRELKLQTEWKLDVAIFRCDAPVEMAVHGNGPLDILATVRGEDLAAVIEIKSAPTKNMWGAFRDDLAKLASITSMYPLCRGYFIGFDKSLSMRDMTSRARPCNSWLDALVEDPAGRVEAHWLEGGEPRSRRGHVRDE